MGIFCFLEQFFLNPLMTFDFFFSNTLADSIMGTEFPKVLQTLTNFLRRLCAWWLFLLTANELEEEGNSFFAAKKIWLSNGGFRRRGCVLHKYGHDVSARNVFEFLLAIILPSVSLLPNDKCGLSFEVNEFMWTCSFRGPSKICYSREILSFSGPVYFNHIVYHSFSSFQLQELNALWMCL